MCARFWVDTVVVYIIDEPNQSMGSLWLSDGRFQFCKVGAKRSMHAISSPSITYSRTAENNNTKNRVPGRPQFNVCCCPQFMITSAVIYFYAFDCVTFNGLKFKAVHLITTMIIFIIAIDVICLTHSTAPHYTTTRCSAVNFNFYYFITFECLWWMWGSAVLRCLEHIYQPAADTAALSLMQ